LARATATPQAIKEKDIGLAFGASHPVSRLENAPSGGVPHGYEQDDHCETH